MEFILKDMYYKQIDRDIKGVIKVGQADDENIKQELEEYVVTKELQKHFADFFASGGREPPVQDEPPAKRARPSPPRPAG